jgi:hypothetical protein
MTMTRFSRMLILALLFSSMSFAIATAAPDGAQAVDEAWRKAITANDLNAIIAVYADDAVMWLPDAPEAKGREAIRKTYADLLAANTVTAATLANTHYRPLATFRSVGATSLSPSLQRPGAILLPCLVASR